MRVGGGIWDIGYGMWDMGGLLLSSKLKRIVLFFLTTSFDITLFFSKVALGKILKVSWHLLHTCL